MIKDPNLKEQLVETYKEIKEIEREKQEYRMKAHMTILLIVVLPFAMEILIKPSIERVANVVKCGQLTEQCLEVLLHHED